jgi:tetratricopeptide (TPR) repeat protein
MMWTIAVIGIFLICITSMVRKWNLNRRVNSVDRKVTGVDAFIKGNDFFCKKRMQEALECFDEAIECGYIDDADVYINRATCLQSLDYPLDSIDDFDRAIALQPENSFTFSQRSLSKSASGDLRGCVSDLQEAIRLADVDNKYTRFSDAYVRELGYKNSAGYYWPQLVRARIHLDELEGSMREYWEKRANRRRRGSSKNVESA